MRKYTIHIAIMLISSLLCMAFASATKEKDDVPTPYPYVYLLEDGRFRPAQMSDSLFYANSQGVVFPVNKYYIPENNPWLRELKEKVQPWASAQGYELTHVEMRGASSPEGPIQWNNTLAENRSVALRDTLRSIFVVGYDLIDPSVKKNPEDYKALVHAMRKKGDADLPVVENILKAHEGNRIRIKAELKRVNGGALWNRLLKDYFPDIRYARVMLYFAPKAEPSVALSDDDALRMLHQQYPYVFVLPPGETKVPKLSDNFYYNHGHQVTFPVNKFDIPKDDAWFEELIKEVEPWARAHNLKLRHVSMRGASSPEGPIKWNDILAENRSKALQDTLQSIFNIDYDIVDSLVMQAPEDYKALLHLMRVEKDPDLKTVENILTKYDWDRVLVKRAMMKANGGRLWNRLLKTYFPRIRYARVYLFFSEDLQQAIGPRNPNKEPRTIRFDSIPDYVPELKEEKMPRRRKLALRSNLLYDGLYMPDYGWAPSPNIAVEYFPSKGRFTYNFELTYPDWEKYSNHHFWQIHDYKFAVRCYTRRTKKAPGDGGVFGYMAADYFQGFFIGAYGQIGRYGIGFNDHKGWEGEYAGGGLQIGYTMPLSKSNRWRLEFTLSGGALVTKYDPYVYGNPISGELDGLYYYDWHHSAEFFVKRNHLFTWLGPTELGLHLTYDLLYKRRVKNGVSTRRWEKIVVPVPAPEAQQVIVTMPEPPEDTSLTIQELETWKPAEH